MTKHRVRQDGDLRCFGYFLIQPRRRATDRLSYWIADLTRADINVVVSLVREQLKTGNSRSIGPADFGRLAGEVRVRPDVRGLSAREVLVVVGLTLLNPHGRRASKPEMTPPELLVNFLLLEMKKRYGEKEIAEKVQAEQAFDLCVAAGCGLLDAPKEGSAWDSVWNPAMTVIVELSRKALIKSEEWLGRVVHGYQQIEEDDLRATADRLAINLLRPVQSRTLSAGSFTIAHTEDGALVTLPELVPSRYAAWAGSQRKPRMDRVFLPPGAKYVFAPMDTALFDVFKLVGDPLKPKKTGEFYLEKESPTVVASLRKSTRTRDQGGRKGICELGVDMSAVSRDAITIEVWQCQCGTPRCKEKHRLTGWIERDQTGRYISLEDFIRSAITGPKNEIDSGVFIEGMYFSQIPGVIVGNVVYMVCPDCFVRALGGRDVNQLSRAEITRITSQALKELDRCEEHDRTFNEEEMKKVLRERLVWVGDPPSGYEFTKLYLCSDKSCENVYVPSRWSQCPFGHPKPQRTSDAWVRRSLVHIGAYDNLRIPPRTADGADDYSQDYEGQ